MDSILHIAQIKQLFIDNHIIDTERTTAEFRVHKPIKREAVMYFDLPWEGDCTGYYNIVDDEGLYRMYYLTRDMNAPAKDLTVPGIVCYAESRDGLKWTKPSLRLYEYKGMWDNNIIVDDSEDTLDNFYVFKDTNPKAPVNERYKGIASSWKGIKTTEEISLWCYTSPDGIHFKKDFMMTDKGHFDSLNIPIYNKDKDLYYCYTRSFHDEPGKGLTRDIRVMMSKDFRAWSEPEIISIDSDFYSQMYTNGMFEYGHGSDLILGLATRYVQREEWTQNYDELCSAEKRRLISEKYEKRSGLALTDCVLLSSRDGVNFHRHDEAFLTPGPEKPDNWFYGNCYPAPCFIDTHSDDEDAPDELSLYSSDNYRTFRPVRLHRYTLRLDGMVSMRADMERKSIVTKAMVFEGSTLHINFATSAAGGVYIRILDENNAPINGYESCEIFGDSVDRRVGFEKPLRELTGKPVKLEFTLADADMYSFWFSEE